MHIRNAELADLDVIKALDHSYLTDHVWQMSGNDTRNESSATFRLASLPRQIQVQYPHDAMALRRIMHRCDHLWVMVAGNAQDVLGYIGTATLPWQNTGFIPCYCVIPPERRKGIGTQLLRAAAQQARLDGLHSLTLDLQTKNYAATRFCQKLGFRFSGYSDHYYSARDIALFFTYRIH
jgi:ribosomal protein S18 acetylase RimI-like enzyme